MGSGKSGLYVNLSQSVGGRPIISSPEPASAHIALPESAISHASVGEFTSTNRLKSGGHGQAGIEELERRGIDYIIEETFPNGVRLGYVPNHYERRRRGLGKKQIGQLWFPKDWSAADIRKAGKAVLGAYEGKIENGSMITGWYNGVKVGVIVRKKNVKTIFPTKEQE